MTASRALTTRRKLGSDRTPVAAPKREDGVAGVTKEPPDATYLLVRREVG